jgi:hypothetical protein
VYTLANIPTSLAVTANSSTQLTVSWQDNGNSAGTEYYVENVTNSTNSGWITNLSYPATSLTCNTAYSFKVKARNSDKIETSPTAEVSQTTSACPSDTGGGESGGHRHDGGGGNGGGGGNAGGGDNGVPPPLGEKCISYVPQITFKRTLSKNSKGEDVKSLQIFLNRNGFVIADKGPGSSGNETEEFGSMTEVALIKFQTQYADQIDLKGKAGKLDPGTRDFINGLNYNTSMLCKVLPPNPPVNPPPPIIPTTTPPVIAPIIPTNPISDVVDIPPIPPISEIVDNIADVGNNILDNISTSAGGVVGAVSHYSGKSVVLVKNAASNTYDGIKAGQQLLAAHVDPETSAGIGTLAMAPSVVVLQYSLGTQAIIINSIGSLYDIWYMFLSFFHGLLVSMGLKTARRRWGTVYDSRTKQPIDPAIVELIDAKTGKVLETSVTDLQGRFGFLDKKGTYIIRAKKTHYTFPSKIVTGYKDTIFDNIYHGEPIEISKPDDVITPNIPMDAVAFDWNQFDKQRIIKFHPNLEMAVQAALGTLFWLGFAFIMLNFITHYNFVNGLFILLYFSLIFLRKMIPNHKLWGRIVSSKINTSGLLLEISPAQISNVVVGRAMTNARGKFFLKTQEKGEYIFRVKKINGSDLDTLLETNVLVGKDGVVNNVINL